MKVAILMSGGIDSPVAADMVLARGADVVAVHMDNRPFTDEKQTAKAVALVRHLAARHSRSVRLYIVQHGKNQMEFAKRCRRNMECLLCRRMMWRVAERIALKEGAQAIVTGESLGQVASQTLKNLRAISPAAAIPIIRPLIGLDKLEIEARAKEAGTYGLSTQPGLCCTIVPPKPVTGGNLHDVLEEEKRVDIAGMVERSVQEVEVMEIDARP